MKYSGIGGQAVMEGVMMKSKTEYAVAVRKPDRDIEVKKEDYIGLTERYRILGFPIIRGIVNFVESMTLGMKTLTYSAGFYEEEEDAKPSMMENAMNNVFKDKAESVVMGLTIVLAVLLAIGLFMLFPFFISELLSDKIHSPSLRGLIEGAIRIVIFITYIKGISLMKDIKRVFMYHGAEHKAINCIENGLELTVKNVKGQSKEHKRCGTSFMLIVMFVSILFFVFIQVETMWMRMVFRILLIPVIAGVSYEYIRLVGKHDSLFIRIISRPGMWLQALTTKEPDEDMIEVAIAAVDSVFDWKGFVGKQDKKELAKKRERKKNTTQYSRGKNKTSNQRKKVEVKKEEAEEKLESQAATTLEEEEKTVFTYLNVDDEDSEEEDEILKALDRYFDAPPNENKKS